MGYNTISHHELKAWCWLTGIKPTAIETRAIFLLDDLFLEFQAKQQEKDK